MSKRDSRDNGTGPGRVLAIVLAGGEGKRLLPLTRDRAKPAVPFGGLYRLIDFALSNLTNAGLRRIVVLTQYKSHSLNRHLAKTWSFSSLLGDYVATVPAQMRTGPHWFAGSADAIYQNLNVIEDERADYVVVLGADHIYRMDPRQMLDAHVRSGAGVTIMAIPVPVGDAAQYGIIDAPDGDRIRSFLEKPNQAAPMPGRLDVALASMGNYVFRADVLKAAVTADAARDESRHDVGGDLIPSLVASQEARVDDFSLHLVPGQHDRERGYWRDVGTIDAYYAASMDLVATHPVFDLYNPQWPILTWQPPAPPAKFVHERGDRTGQAFSSLVPNGAIVSGATVRRSILSPGVRVHSRALVEDCVIFDDVDIGEGAVVRRTIIDKHVRVPPDYRLGTVDDSEPQRFTRSPGGVIALGKGEQLG